MAMESLANPGPEIIALGYCDSGASRAIERAAGIGVGAATPTEFLENVADYSRDFVTSSLKFPRGIEFAVSLA